jgi:hypothetical protein
MRCLYVYSGVYCVWGVGIVTEVGCLIYCENNDFSTVRVASPNWYPSFPDSRPEHSFQESVYIIFLVASVATFPNICSPDVCGWRSSVEVAIVGSFVFF